MNDMLTIQRAAAEKRLDHEETEEFRKKKEQYEAPKNEKCEDPKTLQLEKSGEPKKKRVIIL